MAGQTKASSIEERVKDLQAKVNNLQKVVDALNTKGEEVKVGTSLYSCGCGDWIYIPSKRLKPMFEDELKQAITELAEWSDKQRAVEALAENLLK